MSFPFVKSRPKAKREGDPRRVRDRVRLDTAGKRELRVKRYEFAQGKCETCGKEVPLDGPLEVRAHLSHNEHGARKSDEFHRVKIECYECHIVEGHQGGKCVPKRPGRIMRMAEAIRYWQGGKCFCDQPKPRESSFCAACKEKLSPQQRMDLEELKNADWLQTVALCELTILQSEAHQ